MKPRVLFCNEFSGLNTGYATYGREVMGRLCRSEDLEIAELAAYIGDDDNYQKFPWQVFPVCPAKSNKVEVDRFNSDQTHQYGGFRFEEVCLKFKPTHILSIRDPWMDAFIETSPYRKLYNWIVMPPVDSYPQNEQWLSTYASADGVFAYTDWGLDVLKNEGGNRIKLLGSASPSASSDAFCPILDKGRLKAEFGIAENNLIVGTVMRNQKRKLYPNLFAAFRKFINETDKNVYLYCHTSYPDIGWDIPALIKEHGLSSRVLFTYVCQKCNHYFPSFFHGPVIACPNCKNISCGLSNVSNGLETRDLAKIVNLFDVYVQYSNCLAPGQKILTKTGWENIENIKVGDQVLSHTGEYKDVLQTFEHKHTGTIKKIKAYSDIDSLIVTDEHPLYGYFRVNQSHKVKVRTWREYLKSHINKEKLTFVQAKDVCVGDMIAEFVDRTEVDIDKIDLLDFMREKDSYTNERIFIKKGHDYPRYIDVDSDFCIFAGLFAADGNWINTGCGFAITCNTKETKNIELSTKVIDKLCGSHVPCPYKDRNAIDIRGYSTIVTEFFKLFSKHKDKKLPDFMMLLPLAKQKLILQGLFMGDGHFMEKLNTSIYFTTSYNLYEQLKTILKRLAINFNVRLVKRENRADAYRFEVCGNISTGDISSTKHNARNMYNGSYYLKQVKSIEDIKYDDSVYNIEVKDNNSYATKLCIVHNCEGCGMPAIEAAASGVPVICVDFSAMEDVVRKLKGVPIRLLAKVKESETGRLFAVPDDDHLTEELHTYFSLPKPMRARKGAEARAAFEKHYNWDQTSKKWETAILNSQIEDRWNSPTDVRLPSDFNPCPNMNNAEYVRQLIKYVLADDRYIDSYMELKLVRDLNNTVTVEGNSLYCNDLSYMASKPKFKKFTREDAYNQMKLMRGRINFWEKKRGQNV